MKSIVLIGPESTGKTWLAGLLAGYLKTTWLPEYLREYYDKYSGIEKHQMKIVAERQMAQEEELLNLHLPVVFFDTNIITLKVYHEYYFNETPIWFNELYQPMRYTHYFLMGADIPWVADPQRDSPQVREELFSLFQKEIERLKVNYTLICGNYEQRLQQAKLAVEEHLSD